MTSNFMANSNNSTRMMMSVDSDRNSADAGGGMNDSAFDCGVF